MDSKKDNVRLTVVLDCRDSFNFKEISTPEFQKSVEASEIAVKIIHHPEDSSYYGCLPKYLIRLADHHDNLASLFFSLGIEGSTTNIVYSSILEPEMFDGFSEITVQHPLAFSEFIISSFL